MARKSETQVQANTNETANNEEATSDVVDVSNLQEVKVPTFAERIAAIDEQLAMPGLFDLVKDALQKVRATEIRKEMRSLQVQMRTVRAMLPARQPRQPRKPKAA